MSCYWICYWNPAQEGRFERSSSDGDSTEQDWSGWGLLERLIFPHSQGGDTGSNPVGAAQSTSARRAEHGIVCSAAARTYGVRLSVIPEGVDVRARGLVGAMNRHADGTIWNPITSGVRIATSPSTLVDLAGCDGQHLSHRACCRPGAGGYERFVRPAQLPCRRTVSRTPPHRSSPAVRERGVKQVDPCADGKGD